MANSVGTCYFVSFDHACHYYHAVEGGETNRTVTQKLRYGEIRIGIPRVFTGEKLITIDNGCRYAIIEPEPGDTLKAVSLELLSAINAFLRAPSIGSDVNGTRINVQDFVLRDASKAVEKAERILAINPNQKSYGTAKAENAVVNSIVGRLTKVAKMLAVSSPPFDVWALMGKHNVKQRQAIMQELTGEKLPQAKCGVNELRFTLDATFATIGQPIIGDCIAAMNNDREEKLRKLIAAAE